MKFDTIKIVNELSKNEISIRKREMERYLTDSGKNKKIRNLLAIVYFCFCILCICLGVSVKKDILDKVLIGAAPLILIVIDFIIFEEFFSNSINNIFCKICGIPRITEERSKEYIMYSMQLEVEEFQRFCNHPRYRRLVSSVKVSFCDNEVVLKWKFEDTENGNVISKESVFEVNEIIENCQTEVPILNLANMQLLIPVDDEGNVCTIEESEK